MDNFIFPVDPADPRPDFALWSGWPTRPTHLTTNPEREPATYAADMLQCFCGAHVWIAADGRRWDYGTPPELHRCPTPETPLEAAEAAFDETLASPAVAQETLAGPSITDLVIE